MNLIKVLSCCFFLYTLLGTTIPVFSYEIEDNFSGNDLKKDLDDRDVLSESDAIADQDYRIGGNDLLEITVAGEEDLTQQVRVATSGYISYPLLGRIQCAGKSVAELEDFIRFALAKDYIKDPRVRILVKEYSNVYVFGQIQAPGPLSFKGGMTVLQAVTMAGGFNKIANRRKIGIVRGFGESRQVIYANLAAIAAGKTNDISLQPGDTIVVPESFF